MNDTNRLQMTAKESEPRWEPRPKPPDGAPNVVVIVLDDTGFAHLGCFGSDIETPNVDRLAAGGLRFTNFHTTALCSPSRAALLTGRNHHSVGMRFLSNVDTGFANCRGVITPEAATMAEVLRLNGYSTFALGKWHLANMEDCSPAGPFDHWPLQRGFDQYHGYLGGATDQFSPELVIDNRQVEPPSTDGYHLSEDLVDQAITMISAQQAASPGKQWFTYLAFGATHSPHQAPPEYLAKYRGRYDDGWDVVRQRWFERQLQLGVIPADTVLAPRNPGVEAWSDLPETHRTLFARMQETFAAFLDHTDDQIGRLIEFLAETDQLDDTIVVLVSDNGASREGGQNGVLNELAYFNQLVTPVEDMLDDLDGIGGPNFYNNYPTGWAQVGNTPLRYYKSNTYEGGIRDPLIIHWPAGISDAGGIRDQYHHIIDVAPTIYDCLGIEAPTVHRGVTQKPIEGQSLRYTFASEAAGGESRRRAQYYEMLGHRAVWVDGWKALTLHRQGQPFSDDRWELYHLDTDFAEINDLAESNPEKLAELVERWWLEAGRYGVLPLDDRGVELFVLRRPDAVSPSEHQRFRPGIPHVDRFKAPDTRNRSYEITAKLERGPDDNGVLVASGARTGGHVLYVADGHLVFEYNYPGRPAAVVRSAEPLPSGPLEVRARYDKTAEHRGTMTLLVGDDEVGAGPVETLPFRQTLYGMDIGRDLGPTVTAAYEGPFPFTGRLHWIDYSLHGDRDDLRRAAEAELEAALAEQ